MASKVSSQKIADSEAKLPHKGLRKVTATFLAMVRLLPGLQAFRWELRRRTEFLYVPVLLWLLTSPIELCGLLWPGAGH